ncbi:MAG: phosphoglucosamine mutase [Planctomycetes bacterium]|nr:phosphoglucosamine mutase [Planctomycetota bacterium]
MKYFGTDGIRNKAYEGVLSVENLVKWGKAIATAIIHNFTDEKCLSIVIGRDTRQSGKPISQILIDSIIHKGIDIIDVGVLPTPAIAYLTRFHKAKAGIVISASHNPYRDNGIKVFDADGYKVSEKFELEIEQYFDSEEFAPGAEKVGETKKDGYTEYLDALVQRAGGENAFIGMRLYLDCANGAAYKIAPELFTKLGCDVKTVSCTPDGTNINVKCGAVHPEILADELKEMSGYIGVSLDGDADRAMYIDEHGKVRDGDYWLYIVAKRLSESNELNHKQVVGTIITNLGLELSLEKIGIAFARTDVGDKYISRLMLMENYVLGGEQSGHYLIYTGVPTFTTGDGLLSTIELLKSMKHYNSTLAELSKPLVKMPQLSLNVQVSSKPPLESIPEVIAKIKEIEKKTSGWGRIVFRYSGTEPLARIMVEGKPLEKLETYAHELKFLVERNIGS